MKKFSFIITLILFCGNYLFAQTWDILDKSMTDFGTDWAVAQGSSAGGVVTQQTGYINFTKTNTAASGNWSWLRPATALADLTNGQAYSIEVKARVNPVGFNDDGSNIEANQISLRLKNKASTPIYLRYGDAESGSISTTSSLSTSYKINTSEWQIYRIVFRADLKYDVYIDGVEGPIFEGLQGGTNNDQNGIYFGAESRHRCNMDIEYVKMGTGDFFSKPRISSVILSQESHIAGNEVTVSVTANTIAFNNGEKLLFSLVDGNNNVKAGPFEGLVTNNIAAVNIIIPSNVAIGQYTVKVAANGQIGGMDITPKNIPYEVIDPASVETWDVLNRDFSVKAWNAFPSWALEKGASLPIDFVTQKNGYVNINKTQAYGSGYYGFLISPEVTLSANTAYTYEIKARVQAIDKNEFPDTMKPLPSAAGGYESNQIAFRLNNKYMSVHIMHGDENTGYIAAHVIDGTGICPSPTLKYTLNTSEWHVYRMIFNADNTKYDIYVDGELIFKDIMVISKSGTNIAKIGGESWQRCNMDIEYVKMATGDLVIGDKPRIKSVSLSSDSHVANNERTIQVTVNTLFVNNGEKFLASLTDENGIDVATPVEIMVNTNKGSADLSIPSTVPLGKYVIKVAAANGKIGDETIEPRTIQYVVVEKSPLDTKMLPQVKPVGYVKEKADYKYFGPSKEFIFPSIIDTKKYTVDGKFKNGQAPIDRYYLYYSPHENPGGIYLSTASSLDGPWTEYDGTAGMSPGMVMDFDWAAKQSEIVKNGAERHISGCQVVWNEVQNKYLMYFHGPNTTTHYASSEDLINWTFGESILVANQFSVIGAEASYAKVFEHEIPGLGNKYVMLLMNQESQIRRIYWAHSTDGINWIPVTKPLVSPDLNYKKIPGTNIKPNYDGGGTGAYGNNVSGPCLMEKDGRYFVFVHGCTDHLLVVEVGEGFDMEVHWGEYLKNTDAMFTINGNTKPTRIAAPDFIQDDNGKWYMFFEAGGRLDANIGYAKEPDAETSVQSVDAESSIFISQSFLNAGQALSVAVVDNMSLSELALYGITGNMVYQQSASGSEFTFNVPATAGLYILAVKLDNNTSKEFKILVK